MKQTMANAWHTLSVDTTLAQLKTDVKVGLSLNEVRLRLQHGGKNVLPAAQLRNPLHMLLDQFTDVMVLILMGAALIAGFMGHLQDALVIGVILILNGLLGFFSGVSSST
jgi:Ca2+-transporting ATPase